MSFLGHRLRRVAGNYPEFIAVASTQNSSGSTTLTINKPTGTAEGDLMIACMSAFGASSTWTGDTGWTEVIDQGSDEEIRVAWKLAGAGEGASYTFTNSLGTSKLNGSILTYRNAVYDAIGSIATDADPLVVTGPTVAANFSKLIGFAVRQASGITVTADGAMTIRVTDNDSEQNSYVIADENVMGGASGTRSFGVGSTTLVGGVLLSIGPA